MLSTSKTVCELTARSLNLHIFMVLSGALLCCNYTSHRHLLLWYHRFPIFSITATIIFQLKRDVI